MQETDKLRVGDRVRLSGGYNMEPNWLQSGTEFFGEVSAFIPGQNEHPAAVIELDSPISVDGATGTILVLELRYKGASWGARNIVHLELCDFVPEPKAWRHRKQGKWVESNATCMRVQDK
jgi:hypothetical protein